MHPSIDVGNKQEDHRATSLSLTIHGWLAGGPESARLKKDPLR